MRNCELWVETVICFRVCASSFHSTSPWMTFPAISPISPLAYVFLFFLLSFTMLETMEYQFPIMMCFC